MEIFDFEELIADMLDISDEQREDDDFLEQAFYEKFDIELEQGFKFAMKLLERTPTIDGVLSGDSYHAFMSKGLSVTLMRIKAK